MPKNDPWQRLREQGQVEVCFEAKDGEVIAVNWQDIISKRAHLDEKPDNADYVGRSTCTIVLRELASTSAAYNKYVAANREVEVSADTLLDIYKQANHPVPDALAKRIEQVRKSRIAQDAERERRRIEREKNPPSHDGGHIFF